MTSHLISNSLHGFNFTECCLLWFESPHSFYWELLPWLFDWSGDDVHYKPQTIVVLRPFSLRVNIPLLEILRIHDALPWPHSEHPGLRCSKLMEWFGRDLQRFSSPIPQSLTPLLLGTGWQMWIWFYSYYSNKCDMGQWWLWGVISGTWWS